MTARVLIFIGLFISGCVATDLVVGHESLADGGGTPGLLDAAPMCPPETCSADPGGVCGILPACGCACDTTCRPTGEISRECTAVGASLRAGLCAENTDCGYGLNCQRPAGEPLGICAPFCRGDVDCDLGLCVRIIDDAMTIGVSEFGHCTWSCNPVSGGGCPAPLFCRQVPTVAIDGATRGADICQLAGTAQEAEPCGAHSDCARGHACLSPGYCTRTCRTASDCGGRPCVAHADPTGEIQQDVGFCSIDCDVLSGMGCPLGLSCKLDPGLSLMSEVQWVARCLPAGASSTGQACSIHSDCTAAHLCVANRCLPICAVPGGTCPGGTTCFPTDPRVLLSDQEYGVCA